MDINSRLYEISSIDKELARLRKQVQDLNKKKKNITQNIIDSLLETGEKEVIYKNEKYVLEEKQHRSRKNDKKKHSDTIAILNEAGYYGDDAENIYNKLNTAFQGNEKKVYTFSCKKK
jgi:SOS response regulatory protein OraA/RecX